MKDERRQELLEGITAFTNYEYHKSEVLTELLNLQNQIVNLTFNGDHAENANLKLYDVERHLQMMNEECGHCADAELDKFLAGAKEVCNLIRAEISGNRGEQKAFRNLEYLKVPNKILRNIELQDGEQKTELDAVVITPSGLTVIEVKNTKKNVFIDEGGDYYRTGEYQKWDCNLAEKMTIKEQLLDRAVKAAGYSNIGIQGIIVFTNNYVEIHNENKNLNTCFVSQLNYQIEKTARNFSKPDFDMDELAKVIEAAAVSKRYPFEFDVNQFKRDFVELICKLENANAEKEVEEKRIESIESTKKIKKKGGRKTRNYLQLIRWTKIAGNVAAIVTMSLVTENVIKTLFAE